MSAEIRVAGVNANASSSSPAAIEIATRDWLETQAKVAGYWRDLLIDSNGDLDLIEALDVHEMFLRSAAG
ncbi:hypothetical protein [Hyphobacterium sp.]|uniref:hypothetical protein n=1 Tax=Hyphobacterium sp. TaxID=2004662 RepID=UPI003BAA24CB